eukprot:g2723.t1 g2723   contig12:680277-680785(+)
MSSSIVATTNSVRRQLPRPLRPIAERSARSMHVAASNQSVKTTHRIQRQTQNTFSALSMQSSSTPIRSVENIELLLSNMGASHRASRPTIESMIQGAGMPSEVTTIAAVSNEVTANQIIDLIAQIRSL